MPNRILKESICTSDTIDQLTDAEENLFYRLIVNCDDYGRMDARPAIVLARCYPLRIGVITEDEIQTRLSRLQEVGLIAIYEVDGRPYLQMVTWDKHQQVRAKRSKYPDPPADAINCNQMQSSDSICPRNRIRNRNTKSNSESDTDSKSKPKPLAPAGACYRLFEQEFGRPLSSLEAEEVAEMEQEHGYDLVREALRRAVVQGKRSIRYVQRILQRWKDAGLRSLTEVLDYEARIEKARAGQSTDSAGGNGRDSPPDPAKVVELEKRKRLEKIRAAVTYIRLNLGDNPPLAEAEAMAREYGEDVVADIISRLYGGEPP